MRKLEKINTFVTDQATRKRILTAKIKKKMLDKEVPYREIPPKDFHLYHEAEEKEWNDWPQKTRKEREDCKG